MLTSEQLQQAAAVGRGSVNKALVAYRRHTTRIRTLERVLDPADTNAIGDMTHRESYVAELERRRDELAEVEAAILEAITEGEED